MNWLVQDVGGWGVDWRYGYILKHMYEYVPIGIKRELIKFGGNCDWIGQVVGTIYGRWMTSMYIYL